MIKYKQYMSGGIIGTETFNVGNPGNREVKGSLNNKGKVIKGKKSNKIIVTAGAPLIPDALMSQLKVGGKLVIPVGDDSGQQMISLIRNQHGFEQTTHGNFKFVPLLEQKV